MHDEGELGHVVRSTRPAARDLWQRAARILATPLPPSSSAPPRLALEMDGRTLKAVGMKPGANGNYRWYRSSNANGLDLIRDHSDPVYTTSIDDWNAVVCCQFTPQHPHDSPSNIADAPRSLPDRSAIALARALLDGSGAIAISNDHVVRFDCSAWYLHDRHKRNCSPHRHPIPKDQPILVDGATSAHVDNINLDFTSPIDRDAFVCAYRARATTIAADADSLEYDWRLRDLRDRLQRAAREIIALSAADRTRQSMIESMGREREQLLDVVSAYHAALEELEAIEMRLHRHVTHLQNGLRSLSVSLQDAIAKRHLQSTEKSSSSSSAAPGDVSDHDHFPVKVVDTLNVSEARALSEATCRLETANEQLEGVTIENAQLREKMKAMEERDRRVSKEARSVSALQVDSAERDEKIRVLSADRDRLLDEVLVLEAELNRRARASDALLAELARRAPEHNCPPAPTPQGESPCDLGGAYVVSNDVVWQTASDGAQEEEEDKEVTCAACETAMARHASEMREIQEALEASEARSQLASRQIDEVVGARNALRTRCESLARDLERQMKAASPSRSSAQTPINDDRDRQLKETASMAAAYKAAFEDQLRKARAARPSASTSAATVDSLQTLVTTLSRSLAERNDQVRILQCTNSILQRQINENTM